MGSSEEEVIEPNIEAIEKNITKETTEEETHEVRTDEEGIIRVSAKTNPHTLAQAISFAIYDNKTPVIRAIGAGPVNQAIKGVAIARGYVAVRGMDLYIRPGFDTVMINGKEYSTIVLNIVTG